jgi:transcriptional regulator with XRE-family HTH domain
MSKVEMAQKLGCSDSRIGKIERAEVADSLRMSTMVRMSGALQSRFVYVVLPEGSLQDLVFRQAYHKALTELSLPASIDTDTELEPRTEDALEVRTLELVDSRGLWSPRRPPGPRRW